MRLQARAIALAKEIAGNSPVAVAGTKANLNYSRYGYIAIENGRVGKDEQCRSRSLERAETGDCSETSQSESHTLCHTQKNKHRHRVELASKKRLTQCSALRVAMLPSPQNYHIKWRGACDMRCSGTTASPTDLHSTQYGTQECCRCYCLNCCIFRYFETQESQHLQQTTDLAASAASKTPHYAPLLKNLE
jgi:hypothetical protein